jgi:hypothetical protein
VPELVDRACLPRDSSFVSVGEKTHQRPRQAVAKRQPPSGDYVRRPRRLSRTHHEPAHRRARKANDDGDHEPTLEADREPGCEEGPEPGHEPAHEHKQQRHLPIACQRFSRTGYLCGVAWHAPDPGHIHHQEPGHQPAHKPVKEVSREPGREPADEPGRKQACEPSYAYRHTTRRCYARPAQLPPGEDGAADSLFKVAGEEREPHSGLF